MKWSDADIDFLRANWQQRSHQNLAIALGRTKHAVRGKCHLLGLVDSTAWTDVEVQSLREAYATARKDFLVALARQLGRSKPNISRKARGLGLTNRLRKHGRKDRRRFKTKEEYRQHLSERQKRQIAENGHPRGALGMKHTPESLAKMAAAQKRRSTESLCLGAQKAAITRLQRYGTGCLAGNKGGNPFSRAKRGKRADIGDQFFRSRWEANYARYLNWLVAHGQIRSWAFEPKTFVFHGVTRNPLSYTPDFQVFELDGSYKWHEVKGWMDSPSKSRLKRMAKFYPEEPIVLIDAKCYRSIKRQLGAAIPGWEAEGSANFTLETPNVKETPEVDISQY